MRIGEKIAQLQRSKGWTQQELGKRANLCQCTISNMIHGRVAVGKTTARRLISAFSLNPQEAADFEAVALEDCKPMYTRRTSAERQLVEGVVAGLEEAGKFNISDVAHFCACPEPVIALKDGRIFGIRITLMEYRRHKDYEKEN